MKILYFSGYEVALLMEKKKVYNLYFVFVVLKTRKEKSREKRSKKRKKDLI